MPAFSVYIRKPLGRNDSIATADTHAKGTWTYIYMIFCIPANLPKHPYTYVGMVMWE